MTRSEYKPLVWLALIGIFLYFAVVAWNFAAGQKMEDTSSRPQVSSQKAIDTAVSFLKGKGLGVQPYSKTEAVYQSDKPSSAYLEKNKLTDEYKKRYDDKMPLDFWQVILHSGNDTIVINVGMVEAVVSSWRKTLPLVPVLPTDKLEAEKALLTAGYSLNDFRYSEPDIRSNTHNFVSIANSIGEAQQTIKIEVKQGQITGFQTGLMLPGEFTAWYDKQTRLGQRLSIGSLAASLIMAIAAIVLVIVKSRKVAFSRGIFLTIVFAGTYILHTFNALPGTIADAGPATIDFGKLFYLLFSIGFILLLGAALYFSVISGDQLWKERGWNAWARWREEGYGEHVWKAMGRGYFICLFILGVQQVLFAVAEKSFHSFAINDPSQSTLNMKWPVLFPTLAWMAGISEEILFRLFGIIAIRLLVRNTFIAVLLSGFIWALGHAAYTIYPSYTRIFEVTVLGIIFGYTFLRYGLITAIFTHATMDSILMAMSLMFNGGAINVLAGLGYIVLPAMIAGVIYVLHRLLWRPPRQPVHAAEEPL